MNSLSIPEFLNTLPHELLVRHGVDFWSKYANRWDQAAVRDIQERAQRVFALMESQATSSNVDSIEGCLRANLHIIGQVTKMHFDPFDLMIEFSLPAQSLPPVIIPGRVVRTIPVRSEEHTSELQSQSN